MRPFTLAIASALLIATAGAALADLQPQTATPQIQPIVLGTVTSTTAHTVNVTTTDGEAMTFEFDSRTVKPADLAIETPVRIEFKLLDSGLHLAQRVTPLEFGSHDYDFVHAQRAALLSENEMAENHDSDRAEDMREQGTSMPNDADAQIASNENEDEGNANTNANATATTSNEEQPMPRTASELPWVLSLGVLSLVASAGLWLSRRRRST